MSFRMRCPKCHSSNLDLEEDQRAFLGGGRHQVLLHCYTCGMILYGEARIQEEFERQRVEWSQQVQERQERAAKARAARAARAAVRPRPKPRPQQILSSEPQTVAATAARRDGDGRSTRGPAAEAHDSPSPASSDAQRASAEGSAHPRSASTSAATPPASSAKSAATKRTPAKQASTQLGPPGAARVVMNRCAWKGCDKPARPNSKYCSRNCSNKNARARHAARKRTKKPSDPDSVDPSSIAQA